MGSRTVAVFIAALGVAACSGSTSGASADAGSDGGTGGTAGAGASGAGNVAGAGACDDPRGTWQITYAGNGCDAAGADTVFVRGGADAGTFAARFVGHVPAPFQCAPGDTPSYTTSATFDPATCALELESDARWCYSGEGQCDVRDVQFALAPGVSKQGTATYTRCWNPDPAGPPVDCTVTATRLASPTECSGVTGHDVCNTNAVCDSGCGTACHCESGVWSCTYPKRGDLCAPGDGCTYKQSNLGGVDDLSCTNPAGESFFDGSLVIGGSVCPATKPIGPCSAYPRGLHCDYANAAGCDCAAGDAGDDTWACTG